jgi:hypothetical protein
VNQTTNPDADVWGDGDQASAFEAPNDAVIDVESGEDHVQAEDAHIAGEESYEEAPTSTAKSKPNFAILAAAGVLFVAVLGGVGMVVMEKFGADEVAADSSGAGSVFFAEAPATASASGDAPPPAVPAAPTVAETPTPAILEVGKPLDSLAEAERMAAEPVTVTPAAPAAAAVSLAVPAMAAAPATIEEPALADAPGEKVAPATAKPERKVARRLSTPRKKPEARTQLAKAQPEEIFAINPKLHVVAVYPLSGAHVQAWVSDGRTTSVVRVGDEVSQGVVVTGIKAESLEVLTRVGRVTSRGVLR